MSAKKSACRTKHASSPRNFRAWRIASSEKSTASTYQPKWAKARASLPVPQPGMRTLPGFCRESPAVQRAPSRSPKACTVPRIVRPNIPVCCCRSSRFWTFSSAFSATGATSAVSKFCGCAEAMGENARFLVIDAVVPPGNELGPASRGRYMVRPEAGELCDGRERRHRQLL